jgi:cyclopropane-fatty-acyl-phospholipid synthase
MTIADLVTGVFGEDLPIGLEAYDGSRAGPADPPATLVVKSPDAVRRLLTAPGDLGFGRAYVAGDLDIEGDLFAALELRSHFAGFHFDREQWMNAIRLATAGGVLHRPPIPKEEVHLRGRRHSQARDAAAIAHHYDVSNDFYRIVLGPSMTYSCGVWSSPEVGLEAAQAAKYELISQKLDLKPGMRLLDVGCGWGGMVMHAAQHHGVRAVGVTVSRRQADLAAKRVAEAGLSDRVEIRLQDYRDIHDGPFDAISSIGMFEHVGLSQLETYFDQLYALLLPEGRLLNHAISRPAAPKGKTRSRFKKLSFIDRYVFPDGELHEVGSVVSAIQRRGFEARHVESLREHYALTLRAWVKNLEADWDRAVALVGIGRARVWRLYMAASAVTFEEGSNQIHQVLAVKANGGKSGMALRPVFHEYPVPRHENPVQLV